VECTPHESYIFPIGDGAKQCCIQLGDRLAGLVHIDERFKGNVPRAQVVNETHPLGDVIAGSHKINRVALTTNIVRLLNHHRWNVMLMQPVGQCQSTNPASRNEHPHTCFLSVSQAFALAFVMKIRLITDRSVMTIP
jgi:hypothetical protein